jgi:diguanylate cyclase (GGDEF)-like protein
MAQAKRSERLVGLLFFDLDRFKTINDSLGHHVGDQLLEAVAERISNHIRDCDTVARLGGDEFTVVLESLSHVDEVFLVAQKICDMFASPFQLDTQQIFVTASIGITVFPFDDTDAENLLKNADIAMYRAKENGGNTYAFYEPHMDAHATEWLTLENDLRHALERNEFFLCYQPRVDISTGQILSAEALLRWQHPDHGLVSPAEFIPLLEETGLIVPIGEWVIKTACQQSLDWQSRGLPPLRIAVNISPRQFRQNNLIDLLTETLKTTKLDPNALELEITESMLIENVDVAAETLSAAHDLGIHVSVDDFGTGYSSLSYLKRFRISTLKIDRSFVKDITTDPDDAAIASAIVALAQSLDLNVTAEGVETQEQLAFIRQLGCDEAQGYLFSKPLHTRDFEKLLEQRTVYFTLEEAPLKKQN